MELATFVIPEDEAKAKLDAYAHLVASQRTAEDRAIAAGYRAAARGLPVISLPRTVSAGGFFENGLPKIAVAPAAAAMCHVRWDSWRGADLIYADRDDWNVNRGALVGAHSVRVTVPGGDRPAGRTQRGGSTIVPLIPPEHRPNPRWLRHCHVLWEVEEWTRTVPVDPALLRHIRGDLWSVLAVWDLTELERYVLSQR
jgi:hypothetical protein